MFMHLPFLNFRQYNIAHLEMVNVVLALKIWGQSWANKRVEICYDKRAVVDVLSFGKARDSAGNLCQECMVIVCQL